MNIFLPVLSFLVSIIMTFTSFFMPIQQLNPDLGEIIPDGIMIEDLSQADPEPDHVAPITGDTWEDDDYIYMYNRSYDSFANGWLKYNLDGWGVRVKDPTKTSYGPMKNEIWGKPVVNVDFSFGGCRNLTTAPKLPSNIKSMVGTFWNCTSLTSASLIPNCATAIPLAFSGCTSLASAPEIPDGVISLESTFDGCTSLKGTIRIPEAVTYIGDCFANTTLPITMEYYSSCTAAANYVTPNNVTKVCVD